MHSQTTSRFWKSFNALPTAIQAKVKKAFKLWSEDPNHSSLHFKKIHAVDPIYSVRIDLQYRALGVKGKIQSSGFGSEHMKNTITLFRNANHGKNS